MRIQNTTDKKADGVFSMFDTCPRCHRPLKHVTVTIFGKPHDVTCYGSCGCNESKYDGVFIEPEDRKYANAGIEPKYIHRDVTLRGYHTLVDSGRSLFIYGPNGVGKSTLAANIAKALMGMGKTVLFINSKLLIEEVKKTFSGQNADILDRLYGVDVLVIDDLGKEQATEYSLSMLYAIIEARYGKMKPIVVTSNHSRGELVGRWASIDESTARAIASRLCEGETYEMLERDWRLS